MKNMHSFQKVLHTVGNMLLVLLLLSLVALPGASFGLIKVDEGKVLSSQSVRLNVTMEDLKKDKYIFDAKTDKVIKTETKVQNVLPKNEPVIVSKTEPAEGALIYDTIETEETKENIDDTLDY